MSEPVLWQYNFSNFNEKVRWALDFKRIPHRRRSLMPSFPRAMRFSAGGGTVPVLDLDGERIVDSTRIIEALERRFPEPPLYPADDADRSRALEWEDFFDEEVGHEVRRAGFYDWRDHPGVAGALVTTGQPWIVRRTARWAVPVAMRLYARRRYRIYPADVEEARRKIVVALDRIEAERQPSGYLAGDSFSVADLTAAALMYPFVFARGAVEFQYDYPGLPRTELFELVEGHPAIDWLEDMYRRHRGESAEIAK